MPYDTLIFDLDGTLTDPAVGIVRCMNYALTSMDFAPRSEKEIIPYIGPPLEIALRGLSGSEDENCIKQLIVAYRERYGEFGYVENSVYAGIYELLNTLQATGVRMGICTSKYEKYAIKVLQEFDLFDYFQFVCGSDYHVAKTEQLAQLLQAGTITTASLMIGDRLVDLTAAAENGLHGAGVLWGFGSQEELAGGQSDFIVASPEELADHLQNKGSNA